MDKSVFTREYRIFLRCLRQARKRAGVTQVQLAERLDQTQSWVSKCERGERRLDIVEVRTFCKAMGVSFRAFIDEFDTKIEGRKR
jgi:transcriptional regulator with XRE-family HTH domain